MQQRGVAAEHVVARAGQLHAALDVDDAQSTAQFDVVLGLEVIGGRLTDPAQLDQRVPTVSITHRRLAARPLAEYLAERGVFVWHGHFYALPVTEALDLEPDGLVRIGLLHYNTREEVGRLLVLLRELG